MLGTSAQWVRNVRTRPAQPGFFRDGKEPSLLEFCSVRVLTSASVSSDLKALYKSVIIIIIIIIKVRVRFEFFTTIISTVFFRRIKMNNVWRQGFAWTRKEAYIDPSSFPISSLYPPLPLP